MHLLVDIIDNGVLVAFIVAALFPIIGLPPVRLWPSRKHVRIGFWPWWKSEFGFNVICLELAIALALLPAFLHRIAGLNAATYLFGWVQGVSLWLVPAVIIWRAIIIWHTQRGRE